MCVLLGYLLDARSGARRCGDGVVGGVGEKLHYLKVSFVISWDAFASPMLPGFFVLGKKEQRGVTYLPMW